jgi:dTDP-L-rhamnose 4-epimerase
MRLIYRRFQRGEEKPTMSRKTVLITGGAGFVGSHLAEALVAQGHRVRIYDNLSEQVHRSKLPSYLTEDAEFIRGDVRDLSNLRSAVRNVDVIYHLAAAVGVGQSMYQIADYTAVNALGTANLIQAILDTRTAPEKIIVASSMSIYGEGRYACSSCGQLAPPPRPPEQLQNKQWELGCPRCEEELRPVPTDEFKPLQCSSIYALSKKTQEEMVLLFGRTYRIPSVALRYFNIYGPRQALSNPYTGVMAIFASRLMNGNAPIIFEDGWQQRDFVNVADIVQANLLAMASHGTDGMAVNVGSGRAVTIREVAEKLMAALGRAVPVEISGKSRAGDIRHCFADITTASRLLGYQPRVTLEAGLRRLVSWLESQQASDHVEEAMDRLSVHGLVA